MDEANRCLGCDHEKQCEGNGKKISVIDAGPAGMTVAINLAKLGYKVDILDSNAKIAAEGIQRFLSE